MKLGIQARWLSIFVLGGLLTLAGVAAVRAGSAQSGDPAPDTQQNQTSPPPSKERSGVWHHFGDHNKASVPRPRVTGGWHYFGHPDRAPAPRPAPDRPAPDRPAPARPAPARSAPARSAPRAPRSRPRPRPRQTYRVTTTGEMARQMFELINRDRRRDRRNSGGGRLRPLRWDAKLAQVARAHSLDMARGGYFGHVAPDGQTVIDRLSAAQITWTAEGENIAIDPSVAGAERAFMNEPRFQENHRWNILNSRYTDVGVGVVRGPDGQYYITQDFIEK